MKKLSIVKSDKFNGNKKIVPKFISIGKELSFNYDINIGEYQLIRSTCNV